MSDLTLQQLRAVELILRGNTLTAVAKAVGVTLPVLFDWRYDLRFAEEMAKRQSDIKAFTNAMYVAHAREVLDIVLEIARGKTVYDDDGNPKNTVKDADRLKACAMLNEIAYKDVPTYTTQAEWSAARDNATKSVLGSLWKLSDGEILDRVRGLKLLPGG